jgi:small redox-active disulfide protein 2
MKIEVLGTGCAKCDLLENNTRNVADRLGLDYTLEHVKDIMKITDYGVMITPALVIDGQVIFSGKVPAETELEKILQEKNG